MILLRTARNLLGKCIAAAAVATLLTGVSFAAENGAPPLEKPADAARTEGGETPAIQLPQPDRINGEYLKGYFTDSGRMLVSPSSWDGSDWLKAGLVIGAASGIYFADADIRNFAQRNQSSAGDKAATLGNAIGNPFIAVPSLGLFYLYGHLNEDPKARRTSLMAMESVVISGAFALVVKQATQRPRPFTGEAPTTWKGPGLKSSDPSFPSIHAQTAFSIAAVVAEEYGNNPFVPPLAYGLATLTGLSRIYDNKHWASDVFFGAAVGYIVGKTVVSYHRVQGDTPLKVLPTVTQQGFGVMAEYRF